MTLDDHLLPKRRDKPNYAQVYVLVAVMIFCTGGVHYTTGYLCAFYVISIAVCVHFIYKIMGNR